MSNKWLCIHGHFYQPPRENPWLEEIEYQESAYPFHDWNEQISVKCYQACAEARVLDRDGWVVDVTNLYSKISFNFGPTLLSWMELNDPWTYRKILEGDRMSRERFGGHGGAIAQVYNHVIMPLAGRRDKETEVAWGIADFKRRFSREPEAMWLAETAVDTETLEVLVDYGMKYVILAPRQARAIRSPALGSWAPIENGAFDIQTAYRVPLPSGRSIAAFFYDGGIAQDIAFGGLLGSGEALARRVIESYAAFGMRPGEAGASDRPRLVHVATDGETYGYHHAHGEMALAYAFRSLEAAGEVQLTNYGQFLELCPPLAEVQIHEGSSWSCAHGVERWRSDCGCAADPGRGWQQKWRKPLRAAFDALKSDIGPSYEDAIKELVVDPVAARNEYISVILDRSDEIFDAYVKKVASRDLSGHERSRLAGLLEIQRNLLLIYTSCAWFFDEISGIEATQNLQYAYRAIVLAKSILGLSVEDAFRERLRAAPSNIPEIGSGDVVFDRFAVPARVDPIRLAAHFAVESVFEDFKDVNEIYCFKVMLESFEKTRSGKATLAYGRAQIISKITRLRMPMAFAVIHLGDHNITAGVSEGPGDESGLRRYEETVKALRDAFDRADLPTAMRTLDAAFGPDLFSLKDLFKNEQRRVLNAIFTASLDQIQMRLSDLYQSVYPLALWVSGLHVALPRVYEHIAEFVQSREMTAAMLAPDERMDLTAAFKYIDEAKVLKTHFDETGMSRSLEASLDEHWERMEAAESAKKVTLEAVSSLVALAQRLPFPFDLATTQSRFFGWVSTPGARAARADEKIKPLVDKIASQLKVRVVA